MDECIGRGVYLEIAGFLNTATPPIEHAHMIDFTGAQGTPAEVWVPKAAAGGWFVMTADSGKSKIVAPLHRLLPAHAVSAAYFSGKLCQKTGWEKARAMLAVLPAILAAQSEPKGSRFRVYMKGDGFGLKPWP